VRIKYQILPENPGNNPKDRLTNALEDYYSKEYLKSSVPRKLGNSQIIKPLAACFRRPKNQEKYLAFDIDGRKFSWCPDIAAVEGFMGAVMALCNKFSRQIIPALYQKLKKDFIIRYEEEMECFNLPPYPGIDYIDSPKPDMFTCDIKPEEFLSAPHSNHKNEAVSIYEWVSCTIAKAQTCIDNVAEKTKKQIKESLEEVYN
jgi:hypothetical protein